MTNFEYLSLRIFLLLLCSFCCAWESSPHILHTFSTVILFSAFVTIAVKLCLQIHTHMHYVLQAFPLHGNVTALCIWLVVGWLTEPTRLFFCSQLSCMCVSVSVLRESFIHATLSQVQFCFGSDSSSVRVWTLSLSNTRSCCDATATFRLLFGSVRFASDLVRLFVRLSVTVGRTHAWLGWCCCTYIYMIVVFPLCSKYAAQNYTYLYVCMFLCSERPALVMRQSFAYVLSLSLSICCSEFHWRAHFSNAFFTAKITIFLCCCHLLAFVGLKYTFYSHVHTHTEIHTPMCRYAEE